MGTQEHAKKLAAGPARLRWLARGARQAATVAFSCWVATGSAADAPPSEPARQVAAWAVQTHNHLGRPFVIVDKAQARVLVFSADGGLQASSPVLLGAARGDDSVPGIGQRKIADIRPHERTTPAGRFVAEPGRNAQGEDIVWVDYEAAVSMHRVRANEPKERRLERLASATVADNRISYGCINVPAAFYDRHLKPLFAGARGIVYVLPETRTLSQTFGIGASGSASRSMPDPSRFKG